MLNDWVEVVSNDNLKYVQIAEIYQNSILTKESEFESEEVSIDNIKPIPLTPEILEKNGFEYKEPILATFSEEKVWQIEDSNEQILIELEEQTDDNLVDFYVGRFICGCNNCELFIKHVPQLQHALRLCGIEKTIEL